jgi:chemotaxis protein methyltransferase CheR
MLTPRDHDERTYNPEMDFKPVIPAAASAVSLTDQEYALFQALIYKIAGIRMAESKKILLTGRLSKRLRALSLGSFGEYYKLVTDPAQHKELQNMVDLLTTNETYFFREQGHFDFLAQTVIPKHPRGTSLDIWSAASSTGEEIYTISFVLADALTMAGAWTVTGSDLCTTVLETARRGTYVLERTRGLPPDYLRKYCTTGTGTDAGNFSIRPEITKHTKFLQVNLNMALPPGLGKYHVIFVRNVMIYFDADTKRKVIARIVERLHPGGFLIVGHSESLTGLNETVKIIKPTIYQMPG